MGAEPRLLDQGRAVLRHRYHALHIEEAYVGWTRRYITFCNKHPHELDVAAAQAFLTNFAVHHVTA